MIKEFRDFIMKGNVLDLAVAVIIGGAFGAVVASFTNDIIMPPIGLLLGGVDFSDLKVVLQAAEIGVDGVEAAPEVKTGVPIGSQRSKLNACTSVTVASYPFLAVADMA